MHKTFHGAAVVTIAWTVVLLVGASCVPRNQVPDVSKTIDMPRAHRHADLYEWLQGVWRLKERPEGLEDSLQREYYDEIVITGDDFIGKHKSRNGEREWTLPMRCEIFTYGAESQYRVCGAFPGSTEPITIEDPMLIDALTVKSPLGSPALGDRILVRQSKYGSRGPEVEYIRSDRSASSAPHVEDKK